MHLEILVEEASAEAAASHLVPAILGEDVSFAVHVFQGKPDLLRKLPGYLSGYRHWLPSDWRILVLVDRDNDDCHELKARLERAAAGAAMKTKTAARRGQEFQVLNRLAIEELEGWFFGDVPALVTAYPRVPASLAERARYRDPDHIRGGTWEALERVLQRAGYYAGGMPKVQVARTVTPHMNPLSNSSKSFQVFRDGLLALIP